ncbi:restriction endonuclease subunit S [Vibrio splendidus]
MSQLPKNWSSTQLKNLLSFVLGGDWGKDADYQGDDFESVFCIRGTEFKNWSKEKGITSVERKVKKASAQKRALQIGDILIEISGGGPDQPVGRTVLIDEDALKHYPDYPKVCTNFIRLARPSDTIDSRYLNYYLRSFYASGEVVNYQGGSNNLRNLKFKEYETIEVPVAPSSEQKVIANKLDSLLAKVETAQARLDKIPTILKRFRQSVLAAATSGELTKDWREDHFDLTNKIADVFITEYDGKELSELPIKWGYVSFKDAAEIKSNLVDPKQTPDAIHLAPNHIEANSGRILELVTVEKDGVKSNKHRFFPGQIVYSKIRPYLNKVCAVDFEGLCSADMYPIESKLNREYLLYVMLSEQFVYFTSQQQGRVVLPKINQKALNNIPVPVPPEAEQVEIARVVSELLAKAEVIEKQYKAAKLRVDNLTQSILARAFSGKLFSPISEEDRVAVTTVKAQNLESQQTKREQPKAVDKEPELQTKMVSVTQIETSNEQASEVFQLLKKNSKGMSAQALFDSVSDNTFNAIDDLFSELKKLIEQKTVMQTGEGESSTFKVIKK